MSNVVEDMQIYALYKSGKTYGEIAKIVGMPRNSVAGRIFRFRKENGIVAKPSPIQRGLGNPAKKTKPVFKEVKPPDDPKVIKDFSKFWEMDTCRFIWGDIRESTASFCGHEKKKGSAYCEYHHAKCYKKPGENRD